MLILDETIDKVFELVVHYQKHQEHECLPMHLDVKLAFMITQYKYKDALQNLIHQLSVDITVKPLISLKLPILHLQFLFLRLVLLQHFLDAFDPCSGIFCVLDVVILVFGEALDVEEA